MLRHNILVSYEIATLPSVARNDNLNHLNFVVGLINQAPTSLLILLIKSIYLCIKSGLDESSPYIRDNLQSEKSSLSPFPTRFPTLLTKRVFLSLWLHPGLLRCISLPNPYSYPCFSEHRSKRSIFLLQLHPQDDQELWLPHEH